MPYACIIAGIIIVGIIEVIALLKGLDGQLFATAVAAVLSLVGFLFGKITQQASDRKRGQK